ncbi:protein kinase [bacterium]|nr:protein kinase [bacterium]MCI0603159.1 protein kinase [bacterium]
MQEYTAESFPFVFADRYRIDSLIGIGGMGKIYKAYDLVLHRSVALKFVLTDNPELERRLLREAQAQAKVEDDCICKIFDFGQAEGRLYIAMHYVEGEPFERAAALNIQEKARLMKRVAEAIHVAHQSGLVHRDIKPSNILLERTADGQMRPTILDFGLVRDTTKPDESRSGSVHGTPFYMSPEQALGHVHQVDGRSDIYSIGATFYELFTGHQPFEGQVVEVFIKVIEEEPQPARKMNPFVPDEINTILMKCLEKDRSQRYESAKALSEDLGRFLDGEPILGTPVTWTSRTIRKAKKHRTVSILFAAALIVILLSAGFAIRTWLISREKIRYATEFGQEVKYLEQTLRHMYTSPLHDVRKEEAAAELRLKAIVQRMKSETKAALGPGHYALGRGHLALRRYAEAEKYLRQAWDTYDYNAPEVAYALGLAKAMLYRQELQSLERIPNAEQRETRKREIEKALRDPALGWLRQGEAAAGESGKYGEAVVAYLEKKNEETQQKAMESLRKFPWLYEARKLIGDSYLAIGNLRRDEGRNEEAMANYEKAQAAYAEASSKASSDAEVYLQNCGLQVEIMTLQTYQTGASPEKAYEDALTACKKASIADPEMVDSFNGAAAAHLRWAEFQIPKGEDPRPALQKAIVASQHASGLNSKDEKSRRMIGTAYEIQAEYEINHGMNPATSLKQAATEYKAALQINPSLIAALEGLGRVAIFTGKVDLMRGQDPRQSVDASIGYYRKALSLNQNLAYNHNNLGSAFFLKAQFEMMRGLDPRSSLDEAGKSYHKASDINPGLPAIFINLGSVYTNKALYEIGHGLNPTQSTDLVIQMSRKAIARNPQNAMAFDSLSAGYSVRSQYEMKAGLDAEVSLEQALENSRKANQINPSFDVGRVNLASILTDKALFLYQQKKSLNNVLSEAIEAHDTAIRINPNRPEPHLTYGNLYIIAARDEIRSGKDPYRNLKLAHSRFDKALELYPEFAEARQGKAESFYWQAYSLLNRGRNGATEIDLGFREVEKAIGLNSQLAEAYAIRGMLELLQNRSMQGEASIRKAIGLNGNLKTRYEPYLTSLKRN